MRQKSRTTDVSSEEIVKNIRRATRRRHSAEEKIRIVLDGLRGEISIAELCRREGIAEGLYYSWSKEFLEAGKRRLAGDTARAATSDEVKSLRREAQNLKEVVAEQALDLLFGRVTPPPAETAESGVSVAGCRRVRRTVLVQESSLAVRADADAKIDVGVGDFVVGRAVAHDEEGGVTVGQVQEMVSIARTSGKCYARPCSDRLSTGI